MLLDDDFGPKLVGNERFRTNRFGFKKFMVKAICLQFTTELLTTHLTQTQSPGFFCKFLTKIFCLKKPFHVFRK